MYIQKFKHTCTEKCLIKCQSLFWILVFKNALISLSIIPTQCLLSMISDFRLLLSDTCLLKKFLHKNAVREKTKPHTNFRGFTVLLPGKSHGQRSLVGCTPWGCKKSDMTEWLHFHFSLSCIGGGNGNPLQCSCLEKPRDGGAWWAAIYGVAQGRTRSSDRTLGIWIQKANKSDLKAFAIFQEVSDIHLFHA